MTLPTSDLVNPLASKDAVRIADLDDTFGRQAALSAALVSVFRGNFCDFILPNRNATAFKKHPFVSGLLLA
jgi:hypothetical protein